MAFHLLLAFLPLSAYLLGLGWVRWTGRPLVTTGARDLVALSLGVSGLIAVGPGELFFPSAAGASYGAAVWPMLAFLYYLLVSLVVMNSRPRLVVYGFNEQAISPLLFTACSRLDPAVRADMAAGTISLPSHQVHLRIVAHRGGHSCDIEAFETNVTPAFWRALLQATRSSVATQTASGRGLGLLLMAVGVAMLSAIGWQLISQPEQLATGLSDWLHR